MSSCEVDENYEDFNTKPSCRICYSSRENLISSPCNCIGTLGYVHQSCFLRWIANIKKFDKCEICHQKYHASSLPQRYL
jgi:E3 ubiquitin-protein ligase DOA10